MKTELKLRFAPRRALAAAALVAFGLGASGQVTLENSVMKVERFLDDSGRVETRLVAADEIVPGDELEYTIEFANKGEMPVDPNSIVITNPLPDQTQYIDGTALGRGTEVVFSVDGQTFANADVLTVAIDGTEVPASAKDYTTIRWRYAPGLEPGESSTVSFNVRLK